MLRNAFKDKEYKACIDGLGLLDGEEVKLQYVCHRELVSTGWDGKPKKSQKKGLLVVSNDNLIFMEQSGAWSSNYSQALRIPLEQIIGISSSRGFVIKSITFTTGPNAVPHKFNVWKGCRENTDEIDDVQIIVKKIQNLLKMVREEKMKIAQQSLANGVPPPMIFCRYCGTRNKSDDSFCVNCKAPMK